MCAEFAGGIRMDKKTEQEIIEILDEQIRIWKEEHLAGNIVKEEFHRGAIFGIKMIVNVLAAQPAGEPISTTCPECGESEPVMQCEKCGHNFNRED